MVAILPASGGGISFILSLTEQTAKLPRVAIDAHHNALGRCVREPASPEPARWSPSAYAIAAIMDLLTHRNEAFFKVMIPSLHRTVTAAEHQKWNVRLSWQSMMTMFFAREPANENVTLTTVCGKIASRLTKMRDG